jgi:predicted O-methyltransferase YrrM
MDGDATGAQGTPEQTGAAEADRVRRVRQRLLDERQVTAWSDGGVRSIFPTSITAEEGEALREWVEREDAVVTFETGLGYGISTLFICEGLLGSDRSHARHVAIDPYQTTKCSGVGLQVIEEAGLAELVEFHPEESQIALPGFVAEGRRFDLAFIDGNHRFEGIFLDLIYAGRLVSAGGVVFIDDLQLPAVARATQFCVTNLSWDVEIESRADCLHQWTVLRTPPKPVHRPFDHFVDF